MIKGNTTRKITMNECHWLDRDIEAGEKVFMFQGCTYGCISPDGIAVTFSESGANPFFELPENSVQWEAA